MSSNAWEILQMSTKVWTELPEVGEVKPLPLPPTPSAPSPAVVPEMGYSMAPYRHRSPTAYRGRSLRSWRTISLMRSP